MMKAFIVDRYGITDDMRAGKPHYPKRNGRVFLNHDHSQLISAGSVQAKSHP